MDADTQIDAPVCRQRGIAFGQGSLDLGRTAQGVDNAGELDQQPIAGRLDDAAVMFCNFGVDHLGAERLQPAERPFLIGSNEARVSRHIGGENGRKPAFDASWPFGLHGASPLAMILHQPRRSAH